MTKIKIRFSRPTPDNSGFGSVASTAAPIMKGASPSASSGNSVAPSRITKSRTAARMAAIGAAISPHRECKGFGRDHAQSIRLRAARERLPQPTNRPGGGLMPAQARWQPAGLPRPRGEGKRRTVCAMCAPAGRPIEGRKPHLHLVASPQFAEASRGRPSRRRYSVNSRRAPWICATSATAVLRAAALRPSRCSTPSRDSECRTARWGAAAPLSSWMVASPRITALALVPGDEWRQAWPPTPGAVGATNRSLTTAMAAIPNATAAPRCTPKSRRRRACRSIESATIATVYPESTAPIRAIAVPAGPPHSPQADPGGKPQKNRSLGLDKASGEGDRCGHAGNRPRIGGPAFSKACPRVGRARFRR